MKKSTLILVCSLMLATLTGFSVLGSNVVSTSTQNNTVSCI